MIPCWVHTWVPLNSCIINKWKTVKTPSFIDNTRNMDFSPLPIFTGKSSSIPSLIFQKSQSTLNKVVGGSHYELPHQFSMKNFWPNLVFKKILWINYILFSLEDVTSSTTEIFCAFTFQWNKRILEFLN